MNLKIRELLNIDSSRTTADILVEAIGNNQQKFDELVSFAFTEKSPQNWRAVRVMELICNDYPFLFEKHADIFAAKYPEFKTPGHKRVLPKIFEKYVSLFSEENQSLLIGTCFDYMMSGKEDVAVRVNCMQLLFEFSKIIPDIAVELEACIVILENENSTAILSRSKKILMQLNKL